MDLIFITVNPNLEKNMMSELTIFECISTPDRFEKYAWPRWESNLRPLEY